MITVTNRQRLLLAESQTARFEGFDHGSGVSFFWVDTPPETGPKRHWHPYTETWVVLAGEVEVSAGEETLRAASGDIVTVGPRTPHELRNCGSANLEMVCIHASPQFIQEFTADS